MQKWLLILGLLSAVSAKLQKLFSDEWNVRLIAYVYGEFEWNGKEWIIACFGAVQHCSRLMESPSLSYRPCCGEIWMASSRVQVKWFMGTYRVLVRWFMGTCRVQVRWFMGTCRVQVRWFIGTSWVQVRWFMGTSRVQVKWFMGTSRVQARLFIGTFRIEVRWFMGTSRVPVTWFTSVPVCSIRSHVANLSASEPSVSSCATHI